MLTDDELAMAYDKAYDGAEGLGFAKFHASLRAVERAVLLRAAEFVRQRGYHYAADGLREQAGGEDGA